MSKSDWEWFGAAGHFCCSGGCQFHLTTKVKDYLISTVGELFINGEKCSIGLNEEFYETYVFSCKDGSVCYCGCGLPKPDSYMELEGVRCKTAKEAQENHYRLCNKYDKQKKGKKNVNKIN